MNDRSEQKPGSNSATTRPELRGDLRHWFEGWKTGFQSVLAQVSGQPATFEISLESLPAAATDLWYTVVAGGAVHGEMTLHLSSGTGGRLARKLLGEPEPASPEQPESISTENKEAVEELLRQIAGRAATALAAVVGGEVQLHLSASSAPAWASDNIACLQTRDEAGATVTIEIQLSPALAAEIQQRVAAQSSEARPTPPQSATGGETAGSRNYRRLMDVGLDIKLRFGTRRMLLRDVLALSAGVVVELDNSLHSPVDLLLDGRVIAQGDVVVIDGKYGLRVTSVVDPPPA